MRSTSLFFAQRGSSLRIRRRRAGTERLARSLHAACRHRCAPRDFSQHRTKEIGAAKREVAQIIESLGSPLSSSDQQDHQNCNRNRQNHVQSERTSERCRKRFVEGLANLFHLVRDQTTVDLPDPVGCTRLFQELLLPGG